MFIPLLLSLAQAADLDTARTACDAGDAPACTTLGAAYLKGEGVPTDRFRASQLFRKACDSDHAPACMFLAEAYRKGEGAGADQAKATELYTKACELGNGLACRSVGDLYILGNQFGTDGRTAGLWYQMGCDLGDGQSCTAAGLWMERGDVMAADPEKAAALFQLGCERSHPRGCTLIGQRVIRGASGQKRSVDAAADWFLRACPDDASGDPEGCRELGILLLKGKGVAEDRDAGRERLDRACYRNDAVACRELAALELADDRYDEAMVAGQRGCDLGDSASCKRMERAQFRIALQNAR